MTVTTLLLVEAGDAWPLGQHGPAYGDGALATVSWPLRAAHEGEETSLLVCEQALHPFEPALQLIAGWRQVVAAEVCGVAK